jgi:ribulose 1,5-bisphosphate synthetase/thiazole synthase
LFEERIITETLVIGAGAGGLMAAITVTDCGAHVTLCEKGNARLSGGIPSGNDHFVCYIRGIHKPSVRTKAINDLIGRIMADEDILFNRSVNFNIIYKFNSLEEGNHEKIALNVCL